MAELNEPSPREQEVHDRKEPRSGSTELVVITGMSGAGRTQAIHTFEDLGYFCIDNLPPAFIHQLVDLTHLPGSHIRKIAVVSDVRAQELFDELAGELHRLEAAGVSFHVLFLEADDEVLVRRFKETRRLHPLSVEGDSVGASIAAEREALADIRGRADLVVDTSDLKPAELRSVIRERFVTDGITDSMAVTVVSFGFKYGVPTDADIVMDVRFLPNPFYIAELRDRTGLEEPVRRFVLEREEAQRFLEEWFNLLDLLLPNYLIEGKTHLVLAMGCTGGMHRSVALAEETARHLAEREYRVAVSHRDISKDRESR